MTTTNLLSLPVEVRDHIYDIVFETTSYDYPGTRKAELRVYDGHVMLKRIFPNPPPRWRGIRNLMCTCSTIYHEVLDLLYSEMQFNVKISGNHRDPGPLRNRLTSDYPLGPTISCQPLRHIRTIRLLLDAWSTEEIARLQVRLRGFLDAIRNAPKLNVLYIGFYFDDSSRWSTGQSPMRLSDQVSLMLRDIGVKKQQVEVYDPNRTVSKAMMQELLLRINGKDCTHVGYK